MFFIRLAFYISIDNIYSSLILFSQSPSYQTFSFFFTSFFYTSQLLCLLFARTYNYLSLISHIPFSLPNFLISLHSWILSFLLLYLFFHLFKTISSCSSFHAIPCHIFSNHSTYFHLHSLAFMNSSNRLYLLLRSRSILLALSQFLIVERLLIHRHYILHTVILFSKNL